VKFYSTKKNAPHVDFRTALFNGIAPDGGLYMPEMIPQLSAKELDTVHTIQEAGFIVLRKWITAEEIPDSALKRIVEESLTFPVPLVTAGEYSILELFHGPTMAFKDIAARVLAHLFEYYLEKEKRTMTILVATSGDTGSAIAQAFSGIKRVQVVILYPYGKVSELQEEQLTRVEENVLTIAIDGVFDECQAFVKRAFNDPDLQKLHLSSANSINIGRLLPQIIYYVWAYRRMRSHPIHFVIPSGNHGNATACLFAHKMGIPMGKVLFANNENDVAVTYYQTGIYQGKKTITTLSTAMDIGNPSNFERLLEMFHNNHKAFRREVTATKVSDAETIATIQKVYALDNYLMDFHTAVGYYAAKNLHLPAGKTIVVSTASPLKFAKEIEGKTNIKIDNSQLLSDLRKKEKHVVQAENDFEKIKQLIRSFC
jgi:threonine synthase